MPTIEIHPATPNLVSFSSPNKMWYVVKEGKILCLATSRDHANLIRAALLVSYEFLEKELLRP